MLTTSSNRSEDGRRSGFNGEGWSSAGTAMASGGLSSVLGRFGRGKARPRSWKDGRASGRGCAARGAMNRGGVARFGRCDERRRLELVSALRVSSRKEKTMEGEKTETAPRPDKDAQRSVQGSSTADAWRRRRRAQLPVWPASCTVPSRRCTVSSFE